MNISFHKGAEIETNEAIDFYEQCQEGLGLDFSNELFDTILNIINFPYAWTEFDKGYRRKLLSRFPYGIIYKIDNEEIYILSIMHLKRRPGYWKGRTLKSLKEK